MILGKSYLGNTEASKLYLGDTLVYPTGNPNLIINGTFDTDVTPWVNARGNMTITSEAGKGRSTFTIASTDGVCQQITGLEIGVLYDISYDFDGSGSSGTIRNRISTNQLLSSGNIDVTTHSIGQVVTTISSFTPTATTMWFGFLQTNLQVIGEFFEIDNIIVKKQ